MYGAEIRCKLTSEINQFCLLIRLAVFKNELPYKRFVTVLDEKTMPTDIKKNFINLKNLNDLLQSPRNYKIDQETGRITIVSHITYPNGFTTSVTGTLQLTEEDQGHKGDKEVLKLKQDIEKLKRDVEKADLLREDLFSLKEKVVKIEQGKNRQQESHRIDDLNNKIEHQKGYFSDSLEVMKEASKQAKGQIRENQQHIKQCVSAIIELRNGFEKMENRVNEATEMMLMQANTIRKLTREIEDLKEGKKSLMREPEKVKKVDDYEERGQRILVEINKDTAYSKEFNFNKKYITYFGLEKTTQLLGSNRIKDISVSTLLVATSKAQNLGFGVMDEKYGNERNSEGNENYIMYACWDGGIYEAGKYIRAGSRKAMLGREIEMKVNLILGVIFWKIDGKMEASYSCKNLESKSVNWVPFIRMYDSMDSVVWFL